VPGLDFCNHAAGPACRWEQQGDRVRAALALVPNVVCLSIIVGCCAQGAAKHHCHHCANAWSR
jgi:hypothetical protein